MTLTFGGIMLQLLVVVAIFVAVVVSAMAISELIKRK